MSGGARFLRWLLEEIGANRGSIVTLEIEPIGEQTPTGYRLIGCEIVLKLKTFRTPPIHLQPKFRDDD